MERAWSVLLLLLVSSCSLLTNLAGCEQQDNATFTPTNTTPIATTTTADVPLPIAHRQCDIARNCSLNQICVDGQCRCEANYVPSSNNRQCTHLIDCNTRSGMCSEQDPYRVCSQDLLGLGTCKCKAGFVEDHRTRVCRHQCTDYNDDKYCEQVDGPNTVCNVYRCRCKPNYRRNSATGQCEPFQCGQSSHCWSDGDDYRSCVNGTCACDFEVDPQSQRCLIQFSSIFKARYYSNWQVEKLLLCTIIILPIVFYYCAVQNYRKAKSTLATIQRQAALQRQMHLVQAATPSTLPYRPPVSSSSAPGRAEQTPRPLGPSIFAQTVPSLAVNKNYGTALDDEEGTATIAPSSSRSVGAIGQGVRYQRFS